MTQEIASTNVNCNHDEMPIRAFLSNPAECSPPLLPLHLPGMYIPMISRLNETTKARTSQWLVTIPWCQIDWVMLFDKNEWTSCKVVNVVKA